MTLVGDGGFQTRTLDALLLGAGHHRVWPLDGTLLLLSPYSCILRNVLGDPTSESLASLALRRRLKLLGTLAIPGSSGWAWLEQLKDREVHRD